MISVIIPTCNESACIEGLIHYLKKNAADNSIEIIVSDAGSTDNTLQLAKHAGATALISPQKGRSAQMNYGTSVATGSVFYFVHADSFPPPGFVKDIETAVKNGYDAGRYQTKFLSNKLLLRFNAFFTRFNLFECYGGDQTLFVTHSFFKKIKGFDESKIIMEDYDITKRIQQAGRYKIFSKHALVSARKYENNSWLTVQRANFTAIKMYKKGFSTREIASAYSAMLR